MHATLAKKPVTAFHDPDVALMLRVQRDEPGAFTELAEQHGSRIFARLYRSFHNRQEAEDLTQDVLLRLYRARKRYRPSAKFTTWLFHITQNVARNAFRARRRHAGLRLTSLDGAEEAGIERLDPAFTCPSLPLERSELADAVRHAISGLIGRQRAALEMHEFQDRSYAEIASELSLSPEATKSLLYRARLQLRDMLSKNNDDML